MSLTVGTGPFGEQAAGIFNFTREGPEHVLYWEDSPRKVRVIFNGATVAESGKMKMLHETGLLPTYYFPIEDVNMELLEPTEHSTHCPFKGDASYYTVVVEGRRAENAVWHYKQPLEHSPPLENHVAFYWDRMDSWFEEDEQIFVHPLDPYHRVDIRRSSRHVVVRLDGEVIAETDKPLLLFETGLPTRFYIPREDVRAEVLVPSDTTSECPYKGTATYNSVRIGDRVVDDLVWGYEEPLHDAQPIAGYLAFFNERVDIEVDGKDQIRPKTKWSQDE